MTLKDFLESEGAVLLLFLGAAAAAVLNLRKFWRWLHPYLRRMFPFMFRTAQLQDGMTTLSQQVSKLTTELQGLSKQLMPNGGTSIRDTLDRIEARQIANEEKIRAVLLDSTNAVLEADEGGQCIWVNRRYLRLTGRSLEEVKGFGWLNTIALEDRDRISEEWQLAVREKREFESKYCKLSVDRVRVPVMAHTIIMRRPSGEPIGFLKLVTQLDE